MYEEGNKIKNVQGNRTPDYDICTGNKGRKIVILYGIVSSFCVDFKFMSFLSF